MTWGNVARAIRVEEARFDTRVRASSSRMPTPRRITSSFKTMPSHSLMNENKEMVDSTEEEDGEGYKCDDGNDNDNDFVNLEDE